MSQSHIKSKRSNNLDKNEIPSSQRKIVSSERDNTLGNKEPIIISSQNIINAKQKNNNDNYTITLDNNDENLSKEKRNNYSNGNSELKEDDINININQEFENHEKKKKNERKTLLNQYSNCIIYEIIPIISHFFPFIGHLIIINSKGETFNFISSHFICVKNRYLGNPIKIIKLNLNEKDQLLWDESIKKISKIYQKKEFSICSSNSYTYLANIFNEMEYNGKKNFNVFNLICFCLRNSEYTSFKMILLNYFVLILFIVLFIVLFSILFV